MTAARAGIPKTVWVLGLVSMFMDLSSEMIHALLPIYLVSVLGASLLTVGFIEGVAAEAPDGFGGIRDDAAPA